MRPSPIWLLPPFLAVAAYFAGRANSADPSGSNAAMTADAHQDMAREKPIKDFAAELERLNQEWRLEDEMQTVNPSTTFTKFNGEQLRARIEALMKSREAGEDSRDWDQMRADEENLDKAIHDLAIQEKKEALDWINEHFPAYRKALMQAWAAADPDGALQAVIGSKRKPPCSYDTLSELLQDLATQSPAALREACDQVPWELFSNTDADEDPFGGLSGISIPHGTDPRPWIETGVAEELARKGVSINGLFSEWARLDPAGALARVEDWPDPNFPASTRLGDLLWTGIGDKQRAAKISELLEKLPAESLAKMAVIASENTVHDELVEAYPILRIKDADASKEK
ncbi:hypothetical protein [Luteolibacter luteus]|uniref:Uncharacterized protein n=1 Tax=Luteolibacter luteus TaxID=2728835 RepID=A0A858RCF1_9BACT|nr:hypothetical protein [Luteolibacter luteus]QJE94402.1 hypothetical protein HHL09_00905 [Luteolibacter luteus]